MAPIQHDDSSLIHVERISHYVPLPPTALSSPLPAICASIFSPLLLTYHPPVRGVVLAYEDVQLSSTPPITKSTQASSKKARKGRRQPDNDAELDGQAEGDNEGTVLLRQIDEYASPFLWATASLLVFRPQINTYITARISQQSATHITLSYLNMFPVTILKEKLPSTWKWHTEQAGKKKKGSDGRIADEGGWWVDGDGDKMSAGSGTAGDLTVKIIEWDARGSSGNAGEKGMGFLRIGASLLAEDEEQESGDE